jgi:hypothetical protein
MTVKTNCSKAGKQKAKRSQVRLGLVIGAHLTNIGCRLTSAKANKVTKVVYMSSSFLQVAIGLRDLSQTEKEITVSRLNKFTK